MSFLNFLRFKIYVPWGLNGFLNKEQSIREVVGASLHMLFVHLWTCILDLEIAKIETTSSKKKDHQILLKYKRMEGALELSYHSIYRKLAISAKNLIREKREKS